MNAPRPTGVRVAHWHEQRATWVSVIDGEAAGLDTDGGRWQVCCERHGALLSVTTLKQAREDVRFDPAEFCEDCRELGSAA